MIDSDVFLRESVVREAVARAAETGKVVWPHHRWRNISELWTKRVVEGGHDFGPELDHDDLDVLVDRTNALSWSCCIAIPREAWDRLGGFDERFRGWGFEDMAFQSAVVGLLGFERLPAPKPGEAGFGRTDVFHLWHPRSGERITKGEPAITATRDYVNNGRLGRRYMIALRRDHQQHDRIAPWAPGELERDLANLRRDEERFEGLARRHGLPDWSGWWPTLEELVAGAKEARLGQATVAMIVRTGGLSDRFEERIGYLDRSLASLVARVSGPIGRRVVYSDWDPGDGREARVREVAERHGFYVVGSGNLGYAESINRLWRYIDSRVPDPFVFLAEDDFEYLRDVDLLPAIDAFRRANRLRQIALLRGPAYPREREPGDHILGWPRDAFRLVDEGAPTERLEHRLFWTMNPSLFRRDLVRTPWPRGRSSERLFGDVLLRDPRATFAFLGNGEPWIEHLGEVRAAVAY